MALIDNLVSYWKYDPASGNTYDVHATNILTNNGSIPYVTGIINNGADLEAADAADYFSASDSSGLSFTGDMSWSFWIKPESDPGDPAIIAKWGSAGQRAYYIQLRYSVNAVRLGTSSGGTTLNEGDVTVPAFTVDGTTWYHVVVAYDASAGSFEVYTQGVSRGTDTTVDTSLHDGTSALEIGTYTEGGGRSNWYDGVVDEVGCWNKVLSSTEVTELYNSGSALSYNDFVAPPTNVLLDDLVSYYKLDETSGNAADSEGSNTLTNTGTMTYTSVKINNGAFLEAGKYLTRTSAVLSAVSNIGIAFWIYLPDTSETGGFVRFGSIGGSDGWGVGVGGTQYDNAGNNLIILIDGIAWRSMGALGAAGWKHIVVTRGASTWTAYVNGSALAGAPTDTPTSPSAVTYIGNDQADWPGFIDEIGMWNRELTSADALDLYNSSVGLSYNDFTASASGPANLKTYNTNPKANIKSIDTNLIANVKSLNTNV